MDVKHDDGESGAWQQPLDNTCRKELSTSESWCVWICAGCRESQRERKKIEIDAKNSIRRERVTHHMPKCPQVSHKPPFLALLEKGNLAFQQTLCAKVKFMKQINAQRLRIFAWESLKWPHTKPGLLVPLYFNGQAKVGQLDSGVLAFTGQKQVLRLGGRSGAHSYYCWTKIWYTSPFNT